MRGQSITRPLHGTQCYGFSKYGLTLDRTFIDEPCASIGQKCNRWFLRPNRQWNVFLAWSFGRASMAGVFNYRGLRILPWTGAAWRAHCPPDAVVRAVMPTTLAQMETQEIRWSGSGASQHVWPRVWMLLKSGVRNADFVRLEAIAELLTPPLSFLLTWCLLTALGSLLVDSLPGLYISLILTAGVLYYLGTGIYLLRPPRKIYLALLHAPRFVLWKLWVLLVLKRRGKNAGEWIRTSRTAE